MNDPWQMLGLDPSTANEKDIKVAYARLLKQHRPDVDPVGFRRVYDAYQSALEWLEQSQGGKRQASEAGADTKKEKEPSPSKVAPVTPSDEEKMSLPESPANRPPFEPSTPASNNRDTQAPTPTTGATASRQHTNSRLRGEDEIPKPSAQHAKACSPRADEKLLELKRLLHGWHFPWSVRRAFEAVSRAFEVERVPAAKQSLEWRALFDGNLEQLSKKIPALALVSLVHLDEFFLCYDVVSQWHSQGKWKRMKEFGAALINCGARKISISAGDFVVFLSQRLAIAEPEIADRLASLAFLLLDRAEREHFSNAIARDIWTGRLLIQVHSNYRHFWNVNLAHGAAPMEGTTYRLRRIVLDTVGLMPADWPGWIMIRARMTKDFQVTLTRWLVSRKGSWELDWLHLRDAIENIASSLERMAVYIGRWVLIVVITLLIAVPLILLSQKLASFF